MCIRDRGNTSGLPEFELVNGTTGSAGAISIPPSLFMDEFGNVIQGYSPIGAPIVDSSDNTYVEYEVRNVNSANQITSAVLYLMEIEEAGPITSIQLSSTTSNENMFPGRIIPDGQGGVLATWVIVPSNGSIPANPYQAAYVISGAVTASYSLPFTPRNFVLGPDSLPLSPSPVSYTHLVWKSDDYGRTWTPIFEDQPSQSIGAIAVSPSDPNIVYAASGEGLQRPDLSVGDGIYRSADAGKTWTHLGLRDGQQIPALVVDPRDPNHVFAAVLGHPYGPNEERGIFLSTDGGQTWKKSLYKDQNTGGSDVQIDPANPDVMYASLWKVRQGPWEDGNAVSYTHLRDRAKFSL